MLRDSSDLRVDCLDAGAGSGHTANGSRVALESTENQGSSHTRNIAFSFGIGEGAISGRLLEASGVL